MKKTNTNPGEDALKEKAYQNVMIGLGSKESNNNYKAQNPDSTAAGKYQFTQVWLDDDPGYGVKNIQQFAKDKGIYDIPQTLDDFKADPILQEEYFKYYAKEFLYPQAVKLYNGKNPANLPIEGIMGVLHFQGSGAGAVQVNSGQFNKEEEKGVDGAAADNQSVLPYIKQMLKIIQGSGNELVGKNELIEAGADTNVDLKKAKEDFVKKFELIKASDLDENLKAVKQRELYTEYANKGLESVANEYINDVNKKQEEQFAKQQNLQKTLSNLVFDYGGVGHKRKLKSIKAEKSDEYNAEQAFIDYPEVFRKNKFELKNGEIVFNPNYNLGPNRKTWDTIPQQLFEEAILRDTQQYNPKISKVNLEADAGAKFDKFFGIYNPDIDYTLNLEIEQPIPYPVIDATYKTTDPVKEIKEEPAKTKPESTVEVKSEEEKKTEPETKEEETGVGIAEEYLNREALLKGVKGQQFNYEKGRREIPFDSIMGVGMAMIGNDQAKRNKIPLRTEEVSEAFKAMTSELREKSLHGLPVEVEAKIKNDLAEAYQAGLSNVVNAAAGNRALVLGNVGGLEANKVKGLLDLNIADYQAKEQAFQQYGEALKYINEFDARRDISNHQIKYGEAMRKKMQGEQLATAGFSKLIQDIQYQKENGPGSANHMYKSFTMQKIFGFDPNMPDDGSGKPGTRSAYINDFAKKGINAENSEKAQELFYRLDPEKKKQMNEFVEQNQNFSDVFDQLQKISSMPQQQQAEQVEQQMQTNELSQSMPDINAAIKEAMFNPLEASKYLESQTV